MTDPRTRKMLELHEGRSKKLYRCPAGFNTIGTGHNLDANPLSDQVIDLILDEDIANVEAQLDQYLPWWRDESPARQAALTDLCFNLGISGLLMFKNTLAAFKSKVYESAAIGLEQSKWYGQVGNRAKRIVEMVRSGKWPAELA